MSRAFPERDNCPVPSVTALSGQLESSSVKPPPPLQFCFNPNIFPTPDPPPHNFGCYRPSVGSSKTLVPNQIFDVKIRYPKSSTTQNCEPRFDFRLGCLVPSIVVNRLTAPDFRVRVVDTPAPFGQCDTTFIFDVGFGCPSFNPSESIILNAPLEFKVTISSTGSSECNFDIDFKLKIPCVELSTSTDVIGNPDIWDPIFDLFFVDESGPGKCKQTLFLIADIPVVDVNENNITDGGELGCCTELDVPDADTLVIARTEGTSKLHLDFTKKTIKLPTFELAELTDFPSTLDICTTPGVPWFEAITELNLLENSCSPCGRTLQYQVVQFNLSTSGKTSETCVLCSARYQNSSVVLYTKKLKFKCGIYIGETACTQGPCT